MEIDRLPDQWDGLICSYMVDFATNRWHLVKADEFFTEVNPKTLCGLATDRMTERDETLGGHRATCPGCRKERGLK